MDTQGSVQPQQVARAAEACERYVSLDVLVALLGVPKKSIYSWCARSDETGFPYYRVGKHSRVRLSEVQRWLERYHASPGVSEFAGKATGDSRGPRPLEGVRLPGAANLPRR